MRARTGRTRVRRLVGQNKSSSVSEGKGGKPAAAKAVTYHLPQSEIRLLCNQSPSNAHLGRPPPTCINFLYLFLLLSIEYGVREPFVYFGSAALTLSPPNFLPIAGCREGRVCVWGDVGLWKKPCYCALFSYSQNTGVLPTLIEPQNHMGCGEEH